MCGPFCGKNAVTGITAMGWRTGRYPAGSHTESIGKKDANSYGNMEVCRHVSWRYGS
jgi:hypothetical protein